MIFVDNEIKSLEEDALDFKEYAEMIKQCIDDAGEAPFSIGINGKWGSGKSSLLNLLKIILETQHTESTESKQYMIVWFNAWLYQGYEDARVALLEQLEEAFLSDSLKDEGTKEKLKKIFKKISMQFIFPGLKGVVGLTPGIKEFKEPFNAIIDFVKDSIDADQSSSLNTDINILRKNLELSLGDKKKLIVLVDDLDRCLPETALSTLEAVRLFLHMKNTVVVLAGDKEILQQAVKNQFVLNGSDVDERASSYFDKLITMEINVPTLSEMQISNLLYPLLFAYINPDAQKGNDENIDPEVEKIVDQVKHIFTFSHFFQGNVRNIKLFFNQLVQIEKLLQAKGQIIDRMIIIKILLLQKCGHPSFFDRALLVNQYCSYQNSSGQRLSKNFIVGLFMYEEIFTYENDKITDTDKDKEFIHMWLKMEPKIQRTNYKEKNEKNLTIINKISAQIDMVIDVIEFLVQQHPRKIIINPVLEQIEILVKRTPEFLDMEFIEERKKLGIYHNFLALLEINHWISYTQKLPFSPISWNKHIAQNVENIYYNLLFTLKDAGECWNLTLINFDSMYPHPVNVMYNIYCIDIFREKIKAHIKEKKFTSSQKNLIDDFFKYYPNPLSDDEL
ncbi:P-loop NTPase fold protein (plasmid) [Entomospira entomophila]|uniref:KAP NTPase domain-containing protein n=1 Tax=Entomospira entomophila TaxID=2719988 RepID=A0A968GFL0_9SPIO|nr:P-loop NTPase fold protein [Entomospira entomophilus]NIZ41539.1 hypothetical protein [Entomospira entomophilus]WDI36433.1 P-loop NTPase fold protein [Entomospira entomophilus]